MSCNVYARYGWKHLGEMQGEKVYVRRHMDAGIVKPLWEFCEPTMERMLSNGRVSYPWKSGDDIYDRMALDYQESLRKLHSTAWKIGYCRWTQM